MTMLATDALSGVLRVRPGHGRPTNLRSTRRDWAAKITRGLPAQRLPDRLGSLFTLCGHAHRLCARMAVEAAQGLPQGASALPTAALRDETLREHTRRILLDWPLLVEAGGGAHHHAHDIREALQQCPLFATPVTVGAPAQVLGWLQQHLLYMPAAQWLEGWESAPWSWLSHWSTSSRGWLAQVLAQTQLWADRRLNPVAALRVHASEAGLRLLADTLSRQPDFARHPLWRGQCAETGPWTRLHPGAPAVMDSAWLRLGARLAELTRLVLAAVDADVARGANLSAGSLATARGEGLAWVEMSRGLLLHHVVLNTQGATACVDACHVIAPTEWNFHPLGAVAQALEQMPLTPTPAVQCQVQCLMAAYDPCVRYELEPIPEACHA